MLALIEIDPAYASPDFGKPIILFWHETLAPPQIHFQELIVSLRSALNVFAPLT